MIGNRNKVWIFFISLVFLGTSIFALKAFVQLGQFLSLKERVEVSSIEPCIKKLGSGKYRLKVRYYYTVKNQSYCRDYLVSKYFYKNRWAAQEAFAKLAGAPHSAWYSPHHPEKALFDKSFPVKGVFSAILLIGILIYFYMLARYMCKIE
ncbi:MAG: hypothetical protein S4CHLAM7_10740 [Chlamydiae bacterium]|nr:hypothetical protein [Chlamydiota bacterium]